MADIWETANSKVHTNLVQDLHDMISQLGCMHILPLSKKKKTLHILVELRAPRASSILLLVV